MESITERLNLVRATLLDARSEEDYKAASSRQSAAIVGMLANMAVDPDDLVSLTEALGNVPWYSPADKGSILRKAAEQNSCVKARAKQQNFEAAVAYYTQEHWDVLLNQQHDGHMRIKLLVQHLVQLGLRNPTETTKKLVTCITLLITEGNMRSKFVSHEQFGVAKAHVGTLLSNAKKQKPLENIPELPETPAEFKALYKKTYEAVFVRGEPVPSPFRAMDLLEMMASHKCRGHGPGYTASSAMQRYVGGSPNMYGDHQRHGYNGMVMENGVPIQFFGSPEPRRSMMQGGYWAIGDKPASSHDRLSLPLPPLGSEAATHADTAATNFPEKSAVAGAGSPDHAVGASGAASAAPAAAAPIVAPAPIAVGASAPVSPAPIVAPFFSGVKRRSVEDAALALLSGIGGRKAAKLTAADGKDDDEDSEDRFFGLF